jgi:hypothetical protein
MSEGCDEEGRPEAESAVVQVRGFRLQTETLDKGDGENYRREENGYQRLCVAREIVVDHDVFRPFTGLDGTPAWKV